MSHVLRTAVRVRRLMARRPWVYWTLVAAVALAVAADVTVRVERIDRARSSWGRSVVVLVAERDIAPGETLAGAVGRRTVPAAMAPEARLDPDRSREPAGAVARQHVSTGEILTRADVVAERGPRALVPPGWLAVPVEESPASGATIGDRVRVVSDGVVLGPDAVVVGHVGSTTLVAVPAVEAPALPAAARAGGITLLLVP